MQPVQDLTVDDRVSRTQFQYTLEDPTADELNTYAPRMLAALQKQPDLRDVASDQQVGGLQAKLVYDRETAYRLGISPSTIDQTLYDAYGQREVSTMFTQLNQYHVVLEVNPGFQQNPLNLRNLYIRTAAPGSSAAGGSSSVITGGSTSAQIYGPTSSLTIAANTLSTTASSSPLNASSIPSDAAFSAPIKSSSAFSNGGQVPLAAFTHVEETNAPITVNHQGQFPVVTLSFNLAPNAALGDAITAVNNVKDQMGMPASIQGAFQGTAASFQASLSNEPVLILAAIITVYIVLGILYESYIHPITILSTLSSAGVGALVALWITGNDFSVIALIGIVLLIGIVKKNGIMMVDFALEAERKEGMTPVNAIYQACLLRFRPIMMTTMAALLGGVPLAFGTGVGSELRRPLGISIVGGLLVSQLLTLYTTPVIYIWFDRLAKRLSRHPSRKRQMGPGSEPVGA
jgi:multidrug efflux pump